MNKFRSGVQNETLAIWWGRGQSQFKFVVVVQLLSRIQFCDSTESSSPGFPVLHYLWEFAQTPFKLHISYMYTVFINNSYKI